MLGQAVNVVQSGSLNSHIGAYLKDANYRTSLCFYQPGAQLFAIIITPLTLVHPKTRHLCDHWKITYHEHHEPLFRDLHFTNGINSLVKIMLLIQLNSVICQNRKIRKIPRKQMATYRFYMQFVTSKLCDLAIFDTDNF